MLLSLVNFTRNEYVCLGQPGEEPAIQVLMHLCKHNDWNISEHQIEIVTPANVESLGQPALDPEDSEIADPEGVVLSADLGDRPSSTSASRQDAPRPYWKSLGTDAFDWSARSALWKQFKGMILFDKSNK